MKIHPLLVWIMLLPAGAAAAGLVVDAPPGVAEPRFYEQLHARLDELAQSKDPVLRQLYETARTSPASIHFRPMTDDRSTWSSEGELDHAHTEPDDKQPKSEGRSKPADATVFLPRNAVEPGKTHWKSCTLVHELTHAIDLANGRFSPTKSVRERRATFIQNVCHAWVGYALRSSYHGHFATLDYQEAVRKGAIGEYTHYIFTQSDFPAPPQAKVRTKGTKD